MILLQIFVILIIKITNYQKKNKPYMCVSLISFYSIIKINKKYYPQTLLQECVYKLINKKVENIITNIDLDSSSESENESNNELEYE